MTNHIRRLGVGLMACAAMAAVTACGSSGSGSSSGSTSAGSNTSSGAGTSTGAGASSDSGKPINVLWIGDLTGPTKSQGTVHLAGLKAAADYFNAHGGLVGHHVNVKVENDNADNATSVGDVLKAIGGTPPTLLIPGSEAGTIASNIPVLAKHPNVFAMVLNDGNQQCATDATVKCPSVFSESGTYKSSSEAAAKYFIKKGVKKVGVLEEEIDFTESETPPFVSAMKKAGAQVEVTTFPATAVDVTPEVQELKAKGVQGIYTEALGAPAGYALRARASLSAQSIPVVFDIAASSLDITKEAPASDDTNAFYTTYWDTPASVRTPGVVDLLKYGKKYQSSGDIKGNPIALGGLGWDYLVDLGAALQADGNSFNVQKLDAGMLHIKHTSPLRLFTTSLGFAKDDHEDVLGSAKDYTVIPLGPIVNGQVK